MANVAYSNFIKTQERHFYTTNGNGGKRETALPPEKIILPCGTTPVSLPSVSLCFLLWRVPQFRDLAYSAVGIRLPFCFYSGYFRLTDLMNAGMDD